MTRNVDTEINWDEILVKFDSFEGKIVDFYKENNLNHHQLYYRRKRARKEKQWLFHAVALNDDLSTSAPHIYPQDIINEIKIEIGKAKIYIPSTKLELVSNIINELQNNA